MYESYSAYWYIHTHSACVSMHTCIQCMYQYESVSVYGSVYVFSVEQEKSARFSRVVSYIALKIHMLEIKKQARKKRDSISLISLVYWIIILLVLIIVRIYLSFTMWQRPCARSYPQYLIQYKFMRRLLLLSPCAAK